VLTHLYVPFLELGHTILTNTGTASFITPNKWFAIGYGKEIRKKLICDLNCTYVHGMKKLIRVVFHHPKVKKGYIRIRREYIDDYHPVLYLTAKEYIVGDIKEFAMEDEMRFTDYNTAKEWLSKFKDLNTVEMPDIVSFENIVDWMKNLGFEFKTYVESFRTKFRSGQCKELAIDLIPGLNPYIEIECNNEEELFNMAKQLGLKKDDANYGPYANAFAKIYSLDVNIINNLIRELKFDTVDKHLGKYITVNKDKFDETFEKYRYI